jgi:ATP-dependent DNA helicase 2 subunit 2
MLLFVFEIHGNLLNSQTYSVKEPKQFNDFLKHVYNFCQEKNLQSFCEYLASKGLTLIPKTEAIDRFLHDLFFYDSIHFSVDFSVYYIIIVLCFHQYSDVTDDEARSFLVKSESKSD